LVKIIIIKFNKLPVHPALGDLLEMIHEVFANTDEDLQIGVAEETREFLTGSQYRLQQTIEIVEDSATIEARSGEAT